MALNDVFVDEECLVELVDDESQEKGINSLTELLRELQRNDCSVFVGKDYWEWLVGKSGIALYSILYEEEIPLQLERELIRELTALLGRCQTLDEQEVANSELDCAGGHIESESGIYPSSLRVLRDSGEYPGLVARLGIGFSGNGSANVSGERFDCFFIDSAADLLNFFRNVFIRCRPTGNAFALAVRCAFPNLDFHPKVCLDHLGVDLDKYMPLVVRHLSFLNDDFISVANECNWDLPKIMAAARAMEVDFSDESANTKRDAKKMKERRVTFSRQGEDVTVICSFHTKITGIAGRIHFHPPVPELGQRILIGMFHHHLSV